MIGKRVLDVVLSGFGLVLLAPLLAVILCVVWLQDFHSPFYVAQRAARGGGSFRMIKVRSMIAHADASGVESTSSSDRRITPVGHFVRRWKVDELLQLWNVLKGDMSLVGPRPNTMREVEGYRPDEQRLLSVKPGITDFASIVFSDEGEILRNVDDPDKAYAKLIWPWKSRLGILYVDNARPSLDLKIIGLTILAIFNKPAALDRLGRLLDLCGCEPRLREVAQRRQPLAPTPVTTSSVEMESGDGP